MAAKPRKQILLGQNFLRSSGLVKSLLDCTTICPSETVYEIGPGGGIITAELAQRAKKVVAIEKDARLAMRLRERFRARQNIEIIQKDFLDHRIVDREYKIFASIPYNQTAHIMRKILYERPAPRDCWLIMQREAAQKFSGCPSETLVSLTAKPFFKFKIIRALRRTDFEPVPSVDSVLLHIERREHPLIHKEDVQQYREFVQYGFSRWKRNLRLAFKPVFSYKQWKRLAHELHFPLDATPTDLSFEQWLGLYHGFKQLAAIRLSPNDEVYKATQKPSALPRAREQARRRGRR